MTAPAADPAVTLAAYRRYLDATHAARDMYLHVTEHAHKTYLTGPWPDRDAYQIVERQAWCVYYAAGRAAWRKYETELENATRPDSPPHAAVTSAIYQSLEREHGYNCTECGIPWRFPSPGCPTVTYDVHPRPAEPPPAPASDESRPATMTSRPQPAFTPNPEST